MSAANLPFEQDAAEARRPQLTLGRKTLTLRTNKGTSTMRINGWHRLWILASFLTLVAFAFYVSASWPSEQSVHHSIAFYDVLDPNARAQIAESESSSNAGVQMPNGHVIYLKPEVAASRKTEALLQYQAAVATALRSKQAHLIFQAFIGWLASCIAALVVGHLVAWVIRGFRESTNRSAN